MTPNPRMIASLLFLVSIQANAQIPRERAQPGGPVEEIFWSQHILTTGTVANLPKGNLNFTIMHTFGRLRRGVSDLFGLDNNANIRFGVDYGISDRISFGAGRSRFDKLYDIRFKANLLQQTNDDRLPVQIAVEADLGIRTDEIGFDFVDRLSYLGALHLGRKFSKNISLQISPSFVHLNTVFIETDTAGGRTEKKNSHVAVASIGQITMTRRSSLVFEYILVLGERSDQTANEAGIGMNLETGGHVFQLFFKSSQWLTQQHAVARNVDNVFDGDLRLGFSINRVFRLTGK